MVRNTASVPERPQQNWDDPIMSNGAPCESQTPQEERTGTEQVPFSVIGAVACAFAGAWVVAGSAGLLAYPLRRAVAMTLLVASALIGRPGGLRQPWVPALVGFGLTTAMLVSPLPLLNILACAIVLASLAWASQRSHRQVLLAGTVAVMVLAVYRAVVTGVPWAWLAADGVAGWLGHLAHLVTGKAVVAGPTFAGLDFLVLTGAMWMAWLANTAGPRLARGLYGGLGILAGHLVYLVVLAYAPAMLPGAPIQPDTTQGPWAAFLHKAVPWNLPALACMIHVAVVAAMLRWSSHRSTQGEGVRDYHQGWRVAAVLAAAILPWVAFGHPGRPSLAGKRIVFYEKGFLNWLKPEHNQYGRLSSGMYGMLPDFIASLGARATISPDLSAKDIESADALISIFPDEPWAPGQKERIWDFVRQGGTLLVMGEHTTCDPNDGSNRFNEILGPTAMRVAFDSATFAVGGWLQSYEPILHPTTAGMKDDRNQFGVVIGASLDIHWPARPLLLGKWGWSDAGDPASSRAMMGDDRYNSGERLGDLVLAAEQPLGKGRVVAFGDTSGLTNGINVGSYEYTSRLMAYLAGTSHQAHPAWRQVLTLLVAAVLAIRLARMRDPKGLLLVCAVWAASWTACTAATWRAWQFLPHRQTDPLIRIACLDASHLEAYSGESWRPDGLGGLSLTLMRNGYLLLDLPEVSAERLEGADLLVVVAPSREYSGAERKAIVDFVGRGGHLVIMAGYDGARACRSLLCDLGFYVGLDPNDDREPPALGYFKAPYLRSENQMAYVRFHAAWPIGCTDPNAQVMAYGLGSQPIVMLRRVGSGKVVMVGDTGFAMNKNLENEDGSPFEGMRENADFWRWFITRLRDEPMWIPDALKEQKQPSAKEETP